MPSIRDHQKLIHLWLDRDLVKVLKDYQHDQRFDSLTAALTHMLQQALKQSGYSLPPDS